MFEIRQVIKIAKLVKLESRQQFWSKWDTDTMAPESIAADPCVELT